MSYGYIKTYSDIYHLKEHRDDLFSIPGFGATLINSILSSIEDSRRCYLYQFLMAMDIPMMGITAAETISEYFYGSYDKFVDAIKKDFAFYHIANVSEALSRNIINWYNDKELEEDRERLLKEISFITGDIRLNTSSHIIAVTGEINGLPKEDIKEVLKLMGFPDVRDDIDDDVSILLVGTNPDNSVIGKAMMKCINIIPNSRFQDLCSFTSVK